MAKTDRLQIDGRRPAAVARHATIHDIGRQLGISAMTVWRALNGGCVSVLTRERVLAAVRELDYLPNLSARVLNGKRTGVIGLLVADAAMPARTDLIGAIGQFAKAAGMSLLIYTSGRFGQAGRGVVQRLGGICDGLMVIAPGIDGALVGELARGGRPLVALDHWDDRLGLPVVRGDDYRGALGLVRHLAGLGHRRIAHVGAPGGGDQARERRRGYLDALAEAGIAVRPEWLAGGDPGRAAGFRAVQRLLAQAQAPSAICAADDEMAFGVMDALRARGLRIPDDVSVAGFGDLPTARYSYPGLTTVRLPLAEIGAAAVRLLLRRIDGDRSAAGPMEYASELVVRGSCGPALELATAQRG